MLSYVAGLAFKHLLMNNFKKVGASNICVHFLYAYLYLFEIVHGNV